MRGRCNGLIGNFTIDEVTGCWNWALSKSGGYGMMMYLGQQMNISRLVAHLYHGLDYRQSKIQALHSCDNPACINPKHIFLGTQLDNVRDCISKGRTASQRRGNVCLKGHSLEGGNCRIDGRGDRYCRTCKRDSLQRWRRRNGVKPAQFLSPEVIAQFGPLRASGKSYEAIARTTGVATMTVWRYLSKVP